jgi:iron complex transport system ATP-binding protein
VRLAVEGVGYRIDDTHLLDAVDLEVPSGSMVGLVGPNGSGKSTLLRLLYRALAPQVGTAWLDADALWDLPAGRAAQLVGAVPQEQPGDFDLTVEDLVSLGRFPHQRAMARVSRDDRAIVAAALGSVGLAGLEHRRLDQLSGGERQRAVVARALAQQPAALLLDEPTNHLDVRYQHDLLLLIRQLGLSTLVALHDLNLAGAYCDHVVVLATGQVVAAGPVATVLVPEVIEPAFGVAVTTVTHPGTGRPQLLFQPVEEPS